MLSPHQCWLCAALFTIAAAAAACGRSAGSLQLSRPASSRFNVYVVGEEVAKDCLNGAERTAKIKRNSAAADGCAIAAGADAAYRSQRVSAARKYFTIQYRNDKEGSNSEAPAEVARQIQGDITSLAVIGHTATDTTRLALPLYAEAGIPLLMPVATSPLADRPLSMPVATGPDANRPLPQAHSAADSAGQSYFGVLANLFSDTHWDNTKRQDNAFRLIPNDSYTQGPAIAFVARNLARDGEFVLVADFIDDDKDYAQNLSDLVKKSLGAPAPVSLFLDKTDLEEVYRDKTTAPLKDPVVAQILRSDPKLIVFCGTKERAKALIDGVRRRCRQSGKACPRFLLSDSSRTLTPAPEDANVYVMFPVPGACDASYRCAPADVNNLHSVSVYAGVQSYEMFAYDSILLLSHAIDEVLAAKKPISRGTLAEAMRKTTTFPGVEVPYLFVAGENVHANYYVFSSGPGVTQGEACGQPSSRGNSRPQGAYMTIDCTVPADRLVSESMTRRDDEKTLAAISPASAHRMQ